MFFRRVCVLHGRPVSVSNGDVDAEAPSDFPALRSQKRIDIIPNFSVMIRLTAFLEAARDRLYVTWVMRDGTSAPVLLSGSPLTRQTGRYGEKQ